MRKPGGVFRIVCSGNSITFGEAASEEAEKLRSQGMSGDEIRVLASDHYVAHEYSRAMLDPLWISGPEKFVDTTRVMKVILLKRDKNDPEIARRLEIEEAVQYLVAQPEQFLNPYLIVKTEEKVEVRKRFFRRLFKLAPCYLVNTASDVKTVQQKIRDIVNK